MDKRQFSILSLTQFVSKLIEFPLIIKLEYFMSSHNLSIISLCSHYQFKPSTKTSLIFVLLDQISLNVFDKLICTLPMHVPCHRSILHASCPTCALAKHALPSLYINLTNFRSKYDLRSFFNCSNLTQPSFGLLDSVYLLRQKQIRFYIFSPTDVQLIDIENYTAWILDQSFSYQNVFIGGSLKCPSAAASLGQNMLLS